MAYSTSHAACWPSRRRTRRVSEGPPIVRMLLATILIKRGGKLEEGDRKGERGWRVRKFNPGANGDGKRARPRRRWLRVKRRIANRGVVGTAGLQGAGAVLAANEAGAG